MQRISAPQHKLKQLAVSFNANGELVLSGKGATDKNFSQTLPVTAPCVLLWDNATENFFALPIPGDIREDVELVDVILKVE